MKTWTVVHFLKENAIEAVPTNWIIDNKTCYWPPYLGDTLINALRKGIHIPLDEQWKLHEIKTYKNSTFDCYVTARQKANKALNQNEDISDLASDSPLSVSGRPIRASKKRCSTSDEESIRSIPEPPKFKKSQTFKNSSYKDVEDRSQVPKEITDENEENIDFTNIPIYLQDTTIREGDMVKPLNADDISQIDSLTKTLITDSSVEKNYGIIQETPRVKKIAQNTLRTSSPLNPSSGISTPVSSGSESRFSTGQLNNTITNCSCCKQHPQNYEYFHQIIRKQNLIQATLMQIVQDITVLKNSRGVETETAPTISIFTQIKLPVSSQDELDALEEYLRTEDNMNNSIREIAKIGGDSTEEFIRRVLPKLINDSVLQGYNLLGQKGKKAFTSLLTKTLILNALEKNPPTAANSDKQGEKAIVGFLKGAKERTERQLKRITQN